jgi:hypothetical protein
MRYFTDSVALGSQAWVEEVFERNRERRARELKTPGLEAWRGVAWLGGSTRRRGIAHSENGTQPAHPHELTQISIFSQK